ncbi:MAG: CRTAC1 family protein [Planctomycetota bacterium]
MTALLAAGSVWLAPRSRESGDVSTRFHESAADARCLNRHSMVKLADVFDNVMPWLSSVGASAAAADYDNDGFADLYVTNSGRSDLNRLFHNENDGTFTDVTADAGVGCGNPEGASMHAIFGDVDNDGDLDLYVLKWAEANQLFRNDGGKFTDVSRDAGVDYWGYANGATFLDYDRDGRIDILVGNYFAETIEDPATGQRVRNNLWNPVSTRVMHETFTHASNGGRNVFYRNLSDAAGIRFEEVTESVGLTHTGWTLSVGSGDLNNDGWPDLYVANDFGPDEYYLNTGATEQPPRFRLVVDPRGHPGVGNDWWKGMNVDMGDVNNDGYLDIYVTNILERRYKTDEGNMLWLNCADAVCPGGRGFRNVAQESGTIDGGWGWGGKFADFNNDGLLDVFTVNGFVTGDPNHNYWFAIQEMVTQTKNQTADARDWPVMGTRELSGHEPSRLFIQQPPSEPRTALLGAKGRGSAGAGAHGSLAAPRFVESAIASGITDTYNGRGIALADFNHDGYVDIYVANQGAPSSFYVNQTGPRDKRTTQPSAAGTKEMAGFLWLRLVGRPDAPSNVAGRTLASSADAAGARATLWTATGRQMREVQGGMGFASQSEYALHFGIPDTAAVDRLEVWWPSGRTQTFDREAVGRMLNHHVRLSEGGGEVIPP